MRRVGTLLVLLLLLASWMAPAALASYTSPLPSCCRRSGHHCPQSTEQSFRDARLHCGTCQSLVTSHQAPKLSPVTVGVSTNDTLPFTQEFSSEFSSGQAKRTPSQRAPPSER